MAEKAIGNRSGRVNHPLFDPHWADPRFALTPELKELFNADDVQHWFQLVRRQQWSWFNWSVSATPVYGGVIEIDPSSPGAYAMTVLTGTGVERYCQAKTQVDIQSEIQHAPIARAFVGIDRQLPSQTADADPWTIIRDENQRIGDRIDALHDCIRLDSVIVAEYLLSELERARLDDEWRKALVFAAEDVLFANPEQRARVLKRLIDIASLLRQSQKNGDDQTVWCALRRAASLVAPEQIELLLPFLDRQGIVDTRLVALQCIGRVFELGPPADPIKIQAVANRVADFARKFLDPDIFSAGENAGIAHKAIYALATLADERLPETIILAKQLCRRWLLHQLTVQLRELLAFWKCRNPDIVGSRMYDLVETQLAALAA